MLPFYIGVAALILGYFVYGGFVERIFHPTDHPTPAKAINDGVDYIELPLWRIVLIEFLNIAGLGPIYGAITGALFGPSAFLWIVLGNIFIGATHDYIAGMASVRNKGMSLSELVGKYLGPIARDAMRIISILLMVIVVIVFTKGPTAVLVALSTSLGTPPSWFNGTTIFYTIILYYFLAAFLPIDKLIAPLYPIFGAVLIFTAAALLIRLIAGGYSLPSFTGFQNLHPQAAGNPIFPFLCVTVACGAVSGFHATQAPMMARCLAHEKKARQAFYGAMILEGILAMIWASIPMAFFHQQALATGGDASALGVAKLMLDAGALNNPGAVVNTVSLTLLGSFGGALAVIGVVICPITTGDTCVRSMRLTIADAFNIPQHKAWMRTIILVPILAVSVMLNYIDFNVLWRYLAWTNQVLAVFALWMGTGYLAQTKRDKYHWIATLPASFMTAVCVTYILTTKIGFSLPFELSRNVGIATGVLSVILAHFMVQKAAKKIPASFSDYEVA